jgi:tetratricopeptide (TPR) repeat protein
LLLFLLLRALTANLWPSAFVAAVFAVHPLHVESVAWITERKDMLSGLFGLLALWAYAWYARGPSMLRYLSVAAALTLGLMAKPMLVTWPLVFLLLDYWPLQRPFRAGLLLEKAPLLLLVAASAAVTFLAQRSGGSVISLESVPIYQRIARGAVLYIVYLGKTLWPANLAAAYPAAPIERCWPALGAGALLALLTAGALWGARRGQRWLAVGWFWYLGTLLPTIGLVQVGSQVMADRFLYLPQIGACVALAWGAAHAAANWPYRRWPFAAIAALLLAGFAACAWQQTSYWQNSERLWNSALACTSNNNIAHNNLGLALASRGQAKKAIAHFWEAVKIQPDDSEAQNNLGAALANRGQLDEAIVHFRKAVETKPGNAKAQKNLGMALADHGDLDEAIAHYEEAVAIEPENEQAHNKLASALAARGRLDEAVEHYQKVLDLAAARNDGALADLTRARIRRLQPVAPAGKAP